MIWRILINLLGILSGGFRFLFRVRVFTIMPLAAVNAITILLKRITESYSYKSPFIIYVVNM